jgi:esterase/lipase superfamily enzyme
MKETVRWQSERVGDEIQLVRWGVMGTPVLMFPTAGGDAEEGERFQMLRVLSPLLEAGRVKVYSCDSVAGQKILSGEVPARDAGRMLNAFDSCVYHEVVPAIRTDCRSETIEIITAGASIGAFNALAALARHPDAFSKALCLSGTYDLDRLLKIEQTTDYLYSSPLNFLDLLSSDGPHLAALRKRFVLFAHGQGRAEDPAQCWRMAQVLGSKGIPNRVDEWGPEWHHDWATWRAMMPKYLDELA